ncbi:MAG: hypothetical protein WC831_00525 [Parcubacteria group bacterium]|jgi:hypothetical protein
MKTARYCSLTLAFLLIFTCSTVFSGENRTTELRKNGRIMQITHSDGQAQKAKEVILCLGKFEWKSAGSVRYAGKPDVKISLQKRLVDYSLYYYSSAKGDIVTLFGSIEAIRPPDQIATAILDRMAEAGMEPARILSGANPGGH